MMRTLTIYFSILGILLFSILNLGNNECIETNSSNGTTIIVDINGNGDYISLYDAVWESDNDDIIRIYNGTYNENIRINKEISLIGNGSSTIITPSKNWYNAVIEINSDNVTLSNVHIQCNDEIRAGLSLRDNSNITIENVTITDGVDGIGLSETKHSTLRNLTLSNFTEEGISVYKSDNITIEKSHIENCSYYGLNVMCNDLFLIDNQLFNSSFSFYRFNEIDFSSVNIVNNKINGRTIKFYYQQSNIVINEDSTIIAFNCDNIQMSGQKFIDKYHHIYLYYSDNILFNNNSFSNSIYNKIITYSVNNFEIRNSQFNGTGAEFQNSDTIKISGTTFNGNYTDLLFKETNNITLSDNYFNNNSLDEGGEVGVSIQIALGQFINIHNNSYFNDNIGIYLLGPNNINVKDNTFNKTQFPTSSSSVNDLSCVKNQVKNSLYGYYITQSNKVIVDNSTMIGGTIGINCQDSTDVSIDKCVIKDQYYGGIQLIRVDKGIVKNSHIENSNNSFLMGSVSEFDFSNNIIINNKIGMDIYGIDSSGIFKNFFIDNDIQIKSTERIHLNLPYPIGGNFWSDYSGKDVKKGSQQKDDGSDGFIDRSHYIASADSTDYFPIHVDLYSPTARAGTNLSLEIGEIYHFDGTASTDDQLVTYYKWSFEYNGEQIVREMPEFDFKFDIIGDYNCSLVVEDFAGNFDSDVITISIIDSNPPTIISQGNITINQGQMAIFSANGTTDPSGISDYLWKFNHSNEQIILYGEEASFIFSEVGQHDVILEVIDNSGNIGYHHFYVMVIDTEDPIAVAGIDIEINNGDTVDLDGTDSTDNGMINSYEWSFVYNNENVILNGEANSFVFNIPGVYIITLTVIDGNNNFDTDEIEITVIDTIPPVAKITGKSKLLEGESLQLDGSSSEDNGQIVKYVWTFSDGDEKTIEGYELDYKFQGQGYFIVLLTVYDQGGNSDSVNITVEVPDTIDPVAVAGDDLTVKIGSTVSFDGSGSSDNSGISDYKWSFMYRGTEETLHGESAEFTFEVAGEYEIKLTITDDFLNRGTDTFTIIVMDTGKLKGVVKDSSDNPIEGATITVKDSNGIELTTVSSVDGSFEIDVPEGEVTWKIEKSGYETIEGSSSIEIMKDTILLESETQMKKEESGGFPIILLVIGIILFILMIGVILFIIVRSKKIGEDDNIREEIEEGQTDPQINNSLETQQLDQE